MTEQPQLTCAMILSDKSSGSSMLQRELARHPDVNVVRWTRHQENETLYWNKAAIVLGMPHERLYRSELPMPGGKARDELVEFLGNNLSRSPVIDDGGNWVFEGWRALCHEYSPVLLEKSPHHIHSRSALSLIEECARRYPEIEFRYIGLVRNPIATLYSMWKRWKIHPDKKEHEWIRSNSNLINFLKRNNGNALLIKYEDIVHDSTELHAVFDHINVENIQHIVPNIHGRSVDAWRRDDAFRWNPTPDTVSFAISLGYRQEDLDMREETFRWKATSWAQTTLAEILSVRQLVRRRFSRR